MTLSKGIRETRNDNLVDERHLELRGLEISLLYILGNNALPPEKRRFPRPYAHPYILSLKITSAHWPVRHGLKVGTDRAAVEKVLGKSGDGGPAECVHCADDATQDQVTIC